MYVHKVVIKLNYYWKPIQIVIIIYITSPVVMWLLGNYDVIYDETYDETYGVIYEVIMRKFRASMEPFCNLKISKYVQ